ncbi:tail fiber assembly protein, partial [Staphylococcus nepalensis]|uniref:tail fiber assembly protein n=1 Tax=Staphylococcus nepalensis TaxID=214473 RepID=UPI003F6D4AF3
MYTSRKVEVRPKDIAAPLVEDHRGKTVYDVASGDALFISELGPLPENVTWLSPEGEFQKWNGTA